MAKKAIAAFVLLTAAELGKKFASIGKRATILKRDIQEAAVHCIGHTQLHGDWTLSQRLVESVTSGMRRQALVAFIENNSGVKWDAKAKSFETFKRPDLPKWSAERAEFLLSLDWTEATPEVIKSQYDGLAAAERVISTIKAKMKKHDDLAPHSDIVLAELEAAIERINNLTKIAGRDTSEEEQEAAAPAAPAQQSNLQAA